MLDFEEFKYSPETIRKVLDYCSHANYFCPGCCLGCPFKPSATCRQDLMYQALLYIRMLERDNARAMKTLQGRIVDDDIDEYEFIGDDEYDEGV